MKYFYSCLLLLLALLPASLVAQPQTVDLISQADFDRPLENPHKGWYHHYYDNGTRKYQVEDLALSSKNVADSELSASASAAVSAEVFPLGWYDDTRNAQNLPQIRADGMNTVIPYVNEGLIEDVEAYLDAAAVNGLKVLLEIPRQRIVWQFNFASTIEQARTDLRTYVNRFKDHPALLDWYLYDEPNVSPDPDIRRATTPLALRRAYNLIKEEDPDHRIAIVYNRLPSNPNQSDAVFDVAYLEPTDVVMFDYYPVDVGSEEFQAPKWTDFGPFVARGAALVEEGKPYWKVLQGFGENQFGKRLPTTNEERYMLYTSIVSRATGIFFWAYYRANRAWVDTVLNPIIAEFSPLQAAIAQGPVENIQGEPIVRHSSPDNLDLRYQLFRDPSAEKFFLVVVNESDRAGTATLGVKPERGIASVRDVRSGETIPFANGNPDASLDYTFRYPFGPYGTAVLELPEKQLDVLTALRVPGTLTPGEQLTVSLDYTAATARDIYATVQTDTSPFTRYGNVTKVEVLAGSGTVAISVPVNANTPVAQDAYQMYTFITRRGGGWADRLGQRVQINLDAVAPASNADPVSIRAKGSLGSERMSLLVDDQVVQSWTVSAEADNYVYEGYRGGSVAVRFDNDLISEAGDRNLAIDYVEVCGVQYQTEASSVDNSAPSGCSDTFGDGLVWLWCNATLDFGSVGCSSTARTVAGVDKPEAEAGASHWLRSYPNPATEQLTVEGSEDYQVVLYDMTGRPVMRHHLHGKATLDISHLRPGLYVARMRTTEGQRSSQRLVIE